MRNTLLLMSALLISGTSLCLAASAANPAAATPAAANPAAANTAAANPAAANPAAPTPAAATPAAAIPALEAAALPENAERVALEVRAAAGSISAQIDLAKAVSDGKLGFTAEAGRAYLEALESRGDMSARNALNDAARDGKLGFDAVTGLAYLKQRAARGDKNAQSAQSALAQAALDGKLGFTAETGLAYLKQCVSNLPEASKKVTQKDEIIRVSTIVKAEDLSKLVTANAAYANATHVRFFINGGIAFDDANKKEIGKISVDALKKNPRILINEKVSITGFSNVVLAYDFIDADGERVGKGPWTCYDKSKPSTDVVLNKAGTLEVMRLEALEAMRLEASAGKAGDDNPPVQFNGNDKISPKYRPLTREEITEKGKSEKQILFDLLQEASK